MLRCWPPRRTPRREHGLSPQDALVYAAVLSHLQRVRPAQSCFLNRNYKDFGDPHIVEQLGRLQL